MRRPRHRQLGTRKTPRKCAPVRRAPVAKGSAGEGAARLPGVVRAAFERARGGPARSVHIAPDVVGWGRPGCRPRVRRRRLSLSAKDRINHFAPMWRIPAGSGRPDVFDDVVSRLRATRGINTYARELLASRPQDVGEVDQNLSSGRSDTLDGASSVSLCKTQGGAIGCF